MIELFAIAFPMLLFLFKYILPIIAEACFSNQEISITKLCEEFIQFPIDMMFIAISYIIPKIIQVISLASEVESSDFPVQSLLLYCGIGFIMLLLLPFLVFVSKLAVKRHYQKKKLSCNVIAIILYIVSILCIICSLFLF